MMKQLLTTARQFALANLEWLVLAFILGFVIWVIAAVDSNPVQQREFSERIVVEYKLADDEAVLRDTAQVTRVTVEVRAPRSTWDVLSSDDLRIVADISDLPAGTHTVELTGEIVNDKLKGRIISIAPNSVDVRLVDAGERLVQVVPEISVRPSVEYIVNESAITCDPSQITVRGQAPRVERVVKAVVRLNASNLTTTSTVAGSILLFDANESLVTGLTIDDENVQCQIEVNPREGQALTVEYELTGDLPNGYLPGVVTVDPSEIFVVGDSTAIEALNGVYTVQIDVTDQTSTFVRIIAIDDLPEGVSLQDNTSEITVSVSVSEVPKTVTFTDVQIRILNKDSGLVATLSPVTATISITAPQSIADSITAEDISLSVDLTELGEGEHANLPIEYELLTEVLQNTDPDVTIQPETVTIILDVPALPTPTPSGIFGKRMD